MAEPADILEIQALATRYCFAVDLRDLNALHALLTEDAVFGWHHKSPIEGRDAILEHCRKEWRNLRATLHTVSVPPALSFEGERGAHGLHYGHAEHLSGADLGIVRQAIAYSNSYRKESGAWRICRREVELLYACRIGELDLSYRGKPGSWGAPAQPQASVLLRGWRRISGC